MPRYIDADDLIRVLDAKADMAMGTPKEVFLSVAKMIDYLPTADVVPRAEVAREIFEEIEKIRAKEIRKCEYFLQKDNDASERKYWEGGEHSLRQLSYWISELKKKYTEEQK